LKIIQPLRCFVTCNRLDAGGPDDGKGVRKGIYSARSVDPPVGCSRSGDAGGLFGATVPPHVETVRFDIDFNLLIFCMK